MSLTNLQSDVLVYLTDHPGAFVQEIRIDVATSTHRVNAALNTLWGHGLVERNGPRWWVYVGEGVLNGLD